MKRIAFCLLWLLLALPLHAQEYDYVAGAGGAAAAACTTASDSAIFDLTGLGYSTYDYTTTTDPPWKLGVQFTLASQATLTEYIVMMCDAATNANAIVSVYTDSGATIGTIVADTSVTLAHSSIANCNSYTNTTFTLATPKVLAAGTYWLVLDTDGTSQQFYAGYKSNTGTRAYFRAASGAIANYAISMALMGCD